MIKKTASSCDWVTLRLFFYWAIFLLFFIFFKEVISLRQSLILKRDQFSNTQLNRSSRWKQTVYFSLVPIWMQSTISAQFCKVYLWFPSNVFYPFNNKNKTHEYKFLLTLHLKHHLRLRSPLYLLAPPPPFVLQAVKTILRIFKWSLVTFVGGGSVSKNEDERQAWMWRGPANGKQAIWPINLSLIWRTDLREGGQAVGRAGFVNGHDHSCDVNRHRRTKTFRFFY